MKRSRVIVSILIILFFSYSYGIATVQYKLFPYDIIRSVVNVITEEVDKRSPKYFHRKTFFEVFGRDNYDIVFIGDSITEGAEWEDIFPNYKIANRGIGGDTSSGILDRTDSCILSTKAEKAFIMVGINDFSRGIPVNTVFQNYKRIIEKLQANGFTVYIQSTILGGNRVSALNHSINALNDKLKTFATINKNLTYIDLNKSLSKNGILSKDFTQDDIHLNGNGYKAWKECIEKHVQSELVPKKISHHTSFSSLFDEIQTKKRPSQNGLTA